jgi:RNA polymerase sigma-70 factor (ECF subfamily)
MTDEQLVKRILAGDESAKLVFVIQYQHLIRYIVNRFIIVPYERDDVIQDAFLRIFEKLYTYQFNKAKLSTWIFFVVRTVSIEHIRACVREKENVDYLSAHNWLNIEENKYNPEQALIEQEANSGMYGLLYQLPVLQRRAFEEVYLNNRPYEDVACEFNLPCGKIRSALICAKMRLGKRVNHDNQSN